MSSWLLRGVLVPVFLVLGACDEHGKSPGGVGSRGDAQVGTPDAFHLCGNVSCGSGECVANCLGDKSSCGDDCHTTCLFDPGCEAMQCNPGDTCVRTCNYDCSGMAWDCSASCVPLQSPAQCEAIHDEAECIAREDCDAVYEGSGCAVCHNTLCSCTEPKDRFDRCRTLGPDGA